MILLGVIVIDDAVFGAGGIYVILRQSDLILFVDSYFIKKRARSGRREQVEIIVHQLCGDHRIPCQGGGAAPV